MKEDLSEKVFARQARAFSNNVNAKIQDYKAPEISEPKGSGPGQSIGPVVGISETKTLGPEVNFRAVRSHGVHTEEPTGATTGVTNRLKGYPSS